MRERENEKTRKREREVGKREKGTVEKLDNGGHRTLHIDDDGIIYGSYPLRMLGSGIQLRKPEFTITTSSTSSNILYLFNGNPLRREGRGRCHWLLISIAFQMECNRNSRSPLTTIRIQSANFNVRFYIGNSLRIQFDFM